MCIDGGCDSNCVLGLPSPGESSMYWWLLPTEDSIVYVWLLSTEDLKQSQGLNHSSIGELA